MKEANDHHHNEKRISILPTENDANLNRSHSTKDLKTELEETLKDTSNLLENLLKSIENIETDDESIIDSKKTVNEMIADFNNSIKDIKLSTINEFLINNTKNEEEEYSKNSIYINLPYSIL